VEGGFLSLKISGLFLFLLGKIEGKKKLSFCLKNCCIFGFSWCLVMLIFYLILDRSIWFFYFNFKGLTVGLKSFYRFKQFVFGGEIFVGSLVEFFYWMFFFSLWLVLYFSGFIEVFFKSVFYFFLGFGIVSRRVSS